MKPGQIVNFIRPYLCQKPAHIHAVGNVKWMASYPTHVTFNRSTGNACYGISIFTQKLRKVSPVLALMPDDQSCLHCRLTQWQVAGTGVCPPTEETCSLFG